MLINIEQRKDHLIASYINKEGNVSFLKLNIPQSHQYCYFYSRQNNKYTPGIKSWDDKNVVKFPSEYLDKHRLQEFLMDAGDVVNPLFEVNRPKIYTCDIETDVTDDGFSEPADAKNRINTVSWCHYPNITVFGLKDLSSNQIQSIEDQINEHVKSFNKKYIFHYKQFDNEANMLHDFLYNYARHAAIITGWNFWEYDWQYICNRCHRLNLDITWLSPTGKWNPFTVETYSGKIKLEVPMHKLIVDYMSIYKKWDRILDVKENDTLDYVAGEALNIHKVNYSGTLKDLYAKDYDKYVFYNAIDSVLVELIDKKLKTMDTFLGLGNVTKVEAMGALSPIAMLTGVLTRYAYKRGQVFPKVKKDSIGEEYEGAFVYKPEPNLYNLVASFDFASLYPTIIRQFKISIENFIVRDKAFVPNKNQIKCVNGSVFDISKEPLLPELLTDYYDKRKEAQNISKVAEREVDNLKKILTKRLSKTKVVLG